MIALWIGSHDTHAEAVTAAAKAARLNRRRHQVRRLRSTWRLGQACIEFGAGPERWHVFTAGLLPTQRGGDRG
ncbi:hypothetical protein [Nocardioides sp. 503]|uniref:hypothetical protein n=1 Tax=Nocardioides sp. 503 TaxID=2508326 RepID=UPI00106F79E7|nr:hypothetical protein [Nocardioides sp. 503]